MHLAPKFTARWCPQRKYCVNCVGGMIEGSVIMCILWVASKVQAAGWRRSDHENFRGRPEYYITRKISIRKSERSGKLFAEDLYDRQPFCGLLSSFRQSLTLPVRTFWAIKGKEKKLIIFLYITAVVFLFYTIYTCICVILNH